jgi:uroporphyrinogen-III synthase
MNRRTGRVVLAGYPPDLPDLVSVRSLDRAVSAQLIIAPPDLPRDMGNRATSWVEKEIPLDADDDRWELLTEIVESGGTVLRWYPDNPLATDTGQKDATALHEAEIPIELVPVIPDEIIATTFAGVSIPDYSRTMALVSNEDSSRDVWITSYQDATGARLRISDPGTPYQSSGEDSRGGIGIGGPGADNRICPNWYESLPLFGQRILVTRTISQAPILSRSLRELGAEPVELPAIDIIPNPFPERTAAAVADLPGYDWVIFTSTNGVDVFIDSLRQEGYDARHFGSAQVAAIGNATAERLRRAMIQPDFVPDEFVAEAVLDGLLERGVSGKRVLIPRAEVARTTLPDGLRQHGASVDVVPVYRTIPGTPDPLVIDRIDAGEIDVVTFTSSSTVTNLIEMLDGDAERLSEITIACIGPITEATAREHGLEVSISADEYSIPGLINALCAAEAERNGGSTR